MVYRSLIYTCLGPISFRPVRADDFFAFQPRASPLGYRIFPRWGRGRGSCCFFAFLSSREGWVGLSCRSWERTLVVRRCGVVVGCHGKRCKQNGRGRAGRSFLPKTSFFYSLYYFRLLCILPLAVLLRSAVVPIPQFLPF